MVEAAVAIAPAPKPEKPNTDPLLDYVKAKFKGGSLVEAKRNFSGGIGTVGGVNVPSGGYLIKITAAEQKKKADTKHPDVLTDEQQKEILLAFQDRFVEAGKSEADKDLIAEPKVIYVGVTAAAFDELFELEVPPPATEPAPKTEVKK